MSLALDRFPSLSKSSLTHEELERVDRMFQEFFLPPVSVLDDRYSDTLKAVAEEMAA